MKKGIFLLFLLFMTGTFCWAQQSIKLGKQSITIPDQTIRIVESKYFFYKYYIKYQSDSIFYYEVAESKGDKKEYKSVDIYAFPIVSIDKTSLSVDQINVEPFIGEGHTYFITRVWLEYPYYVKNKVWHYTYDAKGKMKKDDLMYIFIYSDSRQIFDTIKSKIGY